MGRISAVLLTAILLFGCGGDEKSKAPAAMTGNGSDTGVVLNESAALSISDIPIRVQVVPGQFQDLPTLQTKCEQQTCTIKEPVANTSESISLQGLQATDTDSIEDLREAVPHSGENNGVAVYGGSVSFALGEGSSVDAQAYGGWMVHNYFLAAWGTYRDPTIPPTEVGVGFSIGNATGSHPDASATYDGLMLGVDTAGADQGDAVEGDATLDFSITGPGDARMDVSFTNITNRTTKSAYNPIEWSNIQVRADGTFNKRNDMEKIHGIFYGPNHEEIGGTFNRDGVTGAYGAKR